MDDRQILCDLLNRICQTAVLAIARYAMVSGVDPVEMYHADDPGRVRGSMDEHFLPAFVFDHLGRQSIGDGLPVMRLWPTVKSLDGPDSAIKPDLAIFHPQKEGRVLAPLEFKKSADKGALSQARQTLMPIMMAIGCPLGAIVAMHAGHDDSYLKNLKNDPNYVKDTFHSAETTLPDFVKSRYSRFYILAFGLCV